MVWRLAARQRSKQGQRSESHVPAMTVPGAVVACQYSACTAT